MAHDFLDHVCGMNCIQSECTSESVADPIGQSLQGLPQPLTFLESSSSDLLSGDELAAPGVEVVLGDCGAEGLKSFAAFCDWRHCLTKS